MPVIIRSFIAGSIGAVLLSAPAYWGALATLGEAQAQEAFRSGNFPPHPILIFSVPLGAATGIALDPFLDIKQTKYPKLSLFGGWMSSAAFSYFPAFMWIFWSGFGMSTTISAAIITASFPAITIALALFLRFTSKSP